MRSSGDAVSVAYRARSSAADLVRLLDRVDEPAGHVTEVAGVVEGTDGRQEAEHDAGDGGLDAGLAEPEPADRAEHEVGHERAESGAAQHDGRRRRQRGERRARPGGHRRRRRWR